MENYLLSIVIPTKNRQKYCIEAIKQIIKSSENDIQLVIQDNSDEPSLQQYIKDLNRENIYYNYHEGVISFVDNFSEALSFAKGEYVCMIGDDDCILSNIIPVTEFAKANNFDSVIPSSNSVYLWPSENPFMKKAKDGYLCLSFIKDGYSVVDGKKALDILVTEKAGQGYLDINMPRLYHGIIKRDLIDEIKNLTGKCFDGLTPDIYFSVALSVVCKKICKLNFPVTISGICPTSGSADSASGRHTGELKNAPHFRGHTDYKWDEKAPAIYSVESIWAETVLHALQNFKLTDLYDRFAIGVLDGICLSKYPQFSTIIKEHAKANNVKSTTLNYYKSRYIICKNINRVVGRVFRKKGSVKKYYNVSDIDKALELTENELKNRNVLNCLTVK